MSPELLFGVILGGAWVLRELVPLVLKKRNGHNKSGELDPAYWETKFRQVTREETAESFREIKSLLGKLLDRLPLK